MHHLHLVKGDRMKTITLTVNEELAESARRLFGGMGLTTELALMLFLQRSVAEGRMPFDPTAPVASVERVDGVESVPSPSRQNGAITREMCEAVWSTFSQNLGRSYDQHVAAARIEEQTGMNSGSAFIYLVFLSNLVQGRHNKRNMKMTDLEYFMGRIREELGERSHANACASLRKSVPYWDRPAFGKFASRVGAYLDSMGM